MINLQTAGNRHLTNHQLSIGDPQLRLMTMMSERRDSRRWRASAPSSSLFNDRQCQTHKKLQFKLLKMFLGHRNNFGNSEKKKL